MKYKVIRSLTDLIFELEQQKLAVHDVDMRDMKGRVYISKLEQRRKYTFVVLEQPDFDKQKQQFWVKEVYFIILPKLLLIYDPAHSRYVDQFFSEVEQGQFKQVSPASLMIEMLDFFSIQMYRSIPKFNHEVSVIQELILDESNNNDLIGKVHRIKRNLITFNSILEPILDLNRAMLLHKEFSSTEESSEMLQEYSDRIQKVIKSIHNFERQMDLLSQSNESQIARKTNKNLGLLTTINAVLLLPPIVFDTLILFKGYSIAPTEWIIAFVSLIILIIATIFFLKKQKII
jgi:magnesium transporter